MYCSKCGEKLAVDANFCSGCGEKISVPIVGEARSEMTASFVRETSQSRGASITSSYNKQPELRYAGFWQRVGATLIDLFLWLVFVISFELLFPTESEKLSYFPFLFLNVMYYGLLDSSSWQGTIGKKVMGIVVCDLEGNRISFFRAIFRCLFHLFSELILFIGFLMVAFTSKKQALHDMMTGCVVIKK